MKTSNTLFISLLSLFLAQTMNAESIVTTKKDEPDAYYGLDIRGVISPSYGEKLNNDSTGTANTGANPYLNPNDRVGFSTPWTLLMISKTFQETGIQTELWGELVRNVQLTADTRVDGGTKQNPYVVSIRRASIKKTWETSYGNYTLNFGMQELPHTYTQWSNYWKWRYIDRGPLEALGFSPQPADIGLSATGKWSILSAQLMASNGEGYKESQNTNSAGMDVSSRLSVEPELGEKAKGGFHLFYRSENAFGAKKNECFEGKVNCLPNDLNPNTSLYKSNRSLQSDTAGSEVNFIWNGTVKWNFGLGAFFKRQYGSELRDRFQPVSAPLAYGKDRFGRGAYAWFSAGIGDFSLLGRIERGTGSNGIVGTTETQQNEFIPGMGVPISNETIPAPIRSTFPETANGGYSSKSSFRRISVFMEWIVIPQFKMALGYVENKNYDSNGIAQNVYIDLNGNERTEKEYMNQFNVGGPGIVSFSSLDRQIILKTTIEF
ncbi:hypothetical protein EHQ12_01025 [Leptospira gomenensis]|uniref:Porin n=1 Tax=Leptospira gomenensis TaxID=2484974 RepID=A0A5F1Y6V0_9LEPT|nr:hypothetical protein [Leptospira gomenensis]TGK29042.1 hypothetical protein EHQ17_16950 [Leptospira gomenensis]TGK45009.1 hypothetical protein EHQ12_01025 [Leptospira gomenensis]TGK51855.1 hypothetical protein EHQ07_01580 [Leptospira gomenensis]TGK67337.1 hypothetical protein EHQ13_02490 [Leptospira gomenensis]